MEKLHEKFSQKPWNETMKLVRLCMDKPQQTTSTATSACPITSCLGKIERTLYAKSLSAVVNKLESLCKQNGLNSYVSPSGTTYYITSEKFYIEIHLENDGLVKDVKVAYPTKSPLTCRELLELLRIQNYDAFGKILEELLILYQIPGNSSANIKGHAALHTLEKDLCLLSTLHRTPDMDRVTEILCGTVGYIKPRAGGKPLCIEFYLSPYQILEEQLTGLQLSGMTVFLTIGQANETHTLPLSPLVVDYVSGEDGSPNFKFLPLTEVACVDILASFLLTFRQPFPMFLSSSSDLLCFELSPQRGSSLSVTFQHPLQDNLACVVIDILSSREVKCTLHTISEEGALDCSNDFLTRVLNRCMSIPILMRAIYKRAAQQKAAQSMAEAPEQNPNQNKESNTDPSAVGLPSPGDCATTSVSPERSLPETSRQASLRSGTADNASAESSSDGKKENVPLQLSEDKIKEDMYLVSLLTTDDEESLSASSPGIKMEDFDMDYLWVFPE
ncbi:hypothetical protein lerEdw1_012857 [Lerista edwardsae]|nr:hypothetical protein lerEdw1_012857 [Lerista edwardsae]